MRQIDDCQRAVGVQVKGSVPRGKPEFLAERGVSAGHRLALGAHRGQVEGSAIVAFEVKGFASRVVEHSGHRDFPVETLEAGEDFLIQEIGFGDHVRVVANVCALQLGHARVAGGHWSLAVFQGARGKGLRQGHVHYFAREAELAAQAGVLRRNDFVFLERLRKVKAVFRERRHFVGQSAVVRVWEDRVQLAGHDP